MLTKTIFAAGALLSAVAAIPMQAQNKRDVVWETKIEEAYVTVDVTTTLWLNPGETPPTVPAANAPAKAPAHYGHKHHGNNHQPHISPPAESTTTPAAPTSPAETSAPPYIAPTTSAAAIPTSPYVAPSPMTTTTTPVASSPPAYTTPPSSPPAYTPPSSSAPSNGGGSGQQYTGDLTYYTPGLGSCGETNTDSDDIVALAEGMMTAAQVGGNPNANPLCGKSITISYGGVTKTATIMDTCPGCSGGSLDLTPTLFADFAPLGEGRLTGMTWWYNN